MSSILTVTLNPCIDKSSSVGRLVPESKLRCSEVVHEAGGGGINVSKALKKLSMESVALFPAGGHNGNMLRDLLAGDGIDFRSVDTAVETRENWIVLENETNNQFRFTFPGKAVEEKTIRALIDEIRAFAPQYVIASGSLPPGLPDHFYGLIIKTARSVGARCIVDTSGNALQAMENKGAYLIKPNRNELTRMLNRDHLEEDEIDDAARQVVENGYAEIVVVSLGSKGAWLVSADEKYYVDAPHVEKRSTVGAGDSMVAGIVYALHKDATLKEALRFGVACGSAATMNDGTQLFQEQDVRQLLLQMK